MFRLPSTPIALQTLSSPEAISLFSGFSRGSRANLWEYQSGLIESYLDEIRVEVEVLLELSRTIIVPLAMRHHHSLCHMHTLAVNAESAASDFSVYHDQALQLAGHLEKLQSAIDQMDAKQKKAEQKKKSA